MTGEARPLTEEWKCIVRERVDIREKAKE